jgi:hypothetical protein
MRTPVLLAGGAVAAYLLYAQKLPTSFDEVMATLTEGPEETEPIAPPAASELPDTSALMTGAECREGFVMFQGLCEPTQETLDKACGKNYRYDKEKKTCVLAGRLGCKKPLVRVDKPTEENPDNFDCVDPTEYKRDDSADILKTGSKGGDMALNLGAGIVAGVAMDSLLTRAGNAVRDNLLTTSAERAAKQASEKAAKEAAEAAAQKAAKEAAEKAAKTAAEKAAADLAAKKATLLAEKSAKAGATAAKAGKGAALLTKIKGTPFSFIISIIAVILSSVLDIAPESFEACKPGEFDYSTLPDWAKTVIEAVPFVGDLLMLLGPVMCMGKSCAPDEEEQNGLCYKKPVEGWWCEAFLCYGQDNPATIDRPGWSSNGQLHTTTHMTQDTRSDLGRPRLEVGVCPTGSKKDSGGALCYEVPENYSIFWGVARENCQPGETDDGDFCRKVEGCPEGSTQVGEECWATVRVDYLDDCSKGWDGCKHKSWNALKCKRGSDKCSWGCYQDNVFLGCGGCHKKTWTCDEYGDWDCIGGCPSTPHNVQGIVKTSAERVKIRRKDQKWGLPPKELVCPPGMVTQAGWNETCYDPSTWPQGYHMKSAGLISQTCPSAIGSGRNQPEFADYVDIGVSCQRARYNRGAGKPAIQMYVKKKREHPPDQRPPLCKDVANLVSDPNNLLLCIKNGCADDEAPDEKYDFCVQKCRPLYEDQGEYCFRKAGIKDPVTGQIYEAEDSYKKREPTPLTFDVY